MSKRKLPSFDVQEVAGHGVAQAPPSTYEGRAWAG